MQCYNIHLILGRFQVLYIYELIVLHANVVKCPNQSEHTTKVGKKMHWHHWKYENKGYAFLVQNEKIFVVDCSMALQCIFNVRYFSLCLHFLSHSFCWSFRSLFVIPSILNRSLFLEFLFPKHKVWIQFVCLVDSTYISIQLIVTGDAKKCAAFIESFKWIECTVQFRWTLSHGRCLSKWNQLKSVRCVPRPTENLAR